MATMFTILRDFVRRHPFEGTVNCDYQALSTSFTLKMSEKYHLFEAVHAPIALFGRTASLIEDLRSSPVDSEEYVTFMANIMAHAIFGSNMQERAGLGLDDTITICLSVFDGVNISPDNIDIQSDGFQRAVEFLITQGCQNPDAEDVIKARREVIQHAEALTFLVRAVLGNDELSEELICETHEILCGKIPSYNGTNDYAGKYRNVDAMAGGTIFTPPQRIHQEMKTFIDDFEQDLKHGNGEKAGDLDPFFLAADMCQDFVTIHPFLDGNGKMCRLIANTYLLKHTGIVISIGEKKLDRQEYLEIAAYAGDGETEEKARGTLAYYFLGKGEITLKRVKEALKIDG